MKVQGPDVVTITDGEKDGLDRWIRYNPDSYGKERFHLTDYLQVFMAVLEIHPNFQAYNCLDGGPLVEISKELWESTTMQITKWWPSFFEKHRFIYRKNPCSILFKPR